MAEEIYKEWFVNMRFPGHENTPIDYETGLPQGWAEKGFGGRRGCKTDAGAHPRQY